jgi:hypothetical protein
VVKTAAQVEKKKRETEKRKKLERAILKKAAEMPEETLKPGQTLVTGKPVAADDKD